jgi:HAD superfamily hydrolase (TIGR01509 family)
MGSVATLFDFNGVLVDDEHVHLAAFRDVLAPLGIEVTDADYEERWLGFDDAGALRGILADAGRAPSDEDVARLVAAKQPVYMARIAEELVVFEGAAEIVRRRAARGIVGIVSGALRAEIQHVLGMMGIGDAVRSVVAAEATTACKPDPQGYGLALRALGARGAAPDARGVVVVEDSLAGVAAAKGAGLRCAAVAHSYPAERLRAAGADVVAARLAELTDAKLDGALDEDGDPPP